MTRRRSHTYIPHGERDHCSRSATCKAELDFIQLLTVVGSNPSLIDMEGCVGVHLLGRALRERRKSTYSTPNGFFGDQLVSSAFH